MRTLVRDVEVRGRRLDVLLDGAVVASVGTGLDGADTVIDGEGGALLPGLHDHHLHLLAMAAARSSVDVRDGLDPLRTAPGEGWLRATGWTGDGDRHALDAVSSARPVRVQHRSGALWVLNSSACRELHLDEVDLPGVERDADGRATGRLWRLDGWLAERVGRELPDLAAVGRELARFGITGVTDATPDLDRETCALLRSAVPQHVHLLGDPEGDAPVKVLLPDSSLPPYDVLVARLRQERPRPVAVHCVTREALVLLLAAWEEVGSVVGDRIEHGAVVPPELLPLPAAVVTQPGFLSDRGDDYLRDVDPRDLPDLYRYRSLIDAGCTVVPSSDAPFGPLDPWSVLRAARDRRAASGAVLGAPDRVSTATALDGMLRPLHDLTAPPRQVAVGATADLVLLDRPLAEQLAEPTSVAVRRTWVQGSETGY